MFYKSLLLFAACLQANNYATAGPMGFDESFMAMGDLSTRTGLAHRGDELGQLTRTFDQMAQALEHREVSRQSAENASPRFPTRVEPDRCRS